MSVKITTIKLCGKTSDMCQIRLVDDKGKIVADKDGYVPDFIPGEYGDYIILDIDVKSGRILNWKPPTQKQLQDFIKKD